MDKLYFILYMPSCRCDPIAPKEYDEHAQKNMTFLKENEVVIERPKHMPKDPDEKKHLMYWMLTRADNREDALDKALVIMEESEIPNDIYRQMKIDVKNWKENCIDHCGICKPKGIRKER